MQDFVIESVSRKNSGRGKREQDFLNDAEKFFCRPGIRLMAVRRLALCLRKQLVRIILRDEFSAP